MTHSKPKPAFFLAVLAIIAALVGIAVWRFTRKPATDESAPVGKTDDPKTVPTPAGAPVTISFEYSTEKKDWLEAAVAEFAKANPNIHVDARRQGLARIRAGDPRRLGHAGAVEPGRLARRELARIGLEDEEQLDPVCRESRAARAVAARVRRLGRSRQGAARVGERRAVVEDDPQGGSVAEGVARHRWQDRLGVRQARPHRPEQVELGHAGDHVDGVRLLRHADG